MNKKVIKSRNSFVKSFTLSLGMDVNGYMLQLQYSVRTH